jgi:hypothetical protein
MAQASLLSRRDSWFAFEHAMQHRALLGVLAELNGFSLAPYFIEPEQGVDRHANKWHLDHQQAHNDANTDLPSQYYWPKGSKPTFGLRIGQNLIDTRMADERQRRWWEFENHTEHYDASLKVLPAASPKPAPQWKYPFW